MRGSGAALAIAVALAAIGPAAAAREEPALVIGEGSLATRQVVALGRDLVIAGETLRDAAAINGSVRVSGKVGGDLIVLGGDAVLGPEARVVGDAFVLGGQLRAERGAWIGGRAVSYPSVGAAWLTLLEGPSIGLPALSPVVLGAKLALLAAWLALTVVLLATGGHGVLSTSRGIREEPWRNFTVGLSGILAMVLTALFFAALAARLVGAPLLLLVVLLALLLKLWGMVAVFHALGDWAASRLLKRRMLPLNAAVLGLAMLGLVKLVPWVGSWAWTAATLIGVGAALTTKFGRREPWFEPAGSEPLGAGVS